MMMARRAPAPPPSNHISPSYSEYEGEEPESPYDFHGFSEDEFDDEDAGSDYEEAIEHRIPGGHLPPSRAVPQPPGHQNDTRAGMMANRAVPPPPPSGRQDEPPPPVVPRTRRLPPPTPDPEPVPQIPPQSPVSAPPPLVPRAGGRPLPSHPQGPQEEYEGLHNSVQIQQYQPSIPVPIPGQYPRKGSLSGPTSPLGRSPMSPLPDIPVGYNYPRKGSLSGPSCTPPLPPTGRKMSLPGNLPLFVPPPMVPGHVTHDDSFDDDDNSEEYIEPIESQRMSRVPALPPGRGPVPPPPMEEEETYEEAGEGFQGVYEEAEDHTPDRRGGGHHAAFQDPQDTYECPEENERQLPPPPPPLPEIGRNNQNASRRAPMPPNDIYEAPDEEESHLPTRKRNGPQPRHLPEVDTTVYEAPDDEPPPRSNRQPPRRNLPPTPAQNSGPKLPPCPPAPGGRNMPRAPVDDHVPEEYEDMDEMVQGIQQSQNPAPTPTLNNHRRAPAPTPSELNNNRVAAQSHGPKIADTLAIREKRGNLRTVDKVFENQNQSRDETEEEVEEVDLTAMSVKDRIAHLAKQQKGDSIFKGGQGIRSPPPKAGVVPNKITPSPRVPAPRRNDPLPDVPKPTAFVEPNIPGTKRWSDSSDHSDRSRSDGNDSGSGTFSRGGPLPAPPKANPEPQPDVIGYEWYHPNLERLQVEQLLNQNGMYLVRDSKSGGSKAPYTLCVYYNRRVWNLKIRLRDDKKYALGSYYDNEETFKTVNQLIQFHHKTAITLAGPRSGQVKLTEAAPQEQFYDATG